MKKLINLSGEIKMKMMKHKSIRKLWTAISLALVLVLALPRTVFAYPQITDASLTFEGVTVTDDNKFLVVSPGATISASVQVTGTGGLYWDDWKSTSWKISTSDSTGVWTCVDTPDYTDAVAHTENFDITVPSTPGIYNVYFQTWTSNGCYLPNNYSDKDLGSMPNSVVVLGNPDILESYGAGCTTQEDDFGGGQGVCMKATGLEDWHWQIQWRNPNLSVVHTVEADVTGGEYINSWLPSPCTSGTWTVELRKRFYNAVAHTYVYNTVDLDTFNLSCGPALESFQEDSSIVENNFDYGDAVWMKGTALGTNLFYQWRIQWWAPGASSATRTNQAPPYTFNSYSDLWEPSPCVAGTWTVNLDRRLLISLNNDWSTADTDTFNLTCDTCTPPSVTINPSNKTITYGDDVSFSVVGTDYTSIQWQVNSGSGWTDISGAITTTLTLSQPAVSQSGNQYRAILTGGCAPSATSAAATLIVNVDPFIGFSGLTSSLNPSVVGDSVTFTAVASTSGGAPAGKVVFYELIPGMFGFDPISLGEDTTGDSMGDNSYAYTFSTSALAIGDHYIIAGYDDGNGTSYTPTDPINQSVTDQIWPTVTITSAPPETTYSTDATFEFSSNTAGTAFECSLNDGDLSNLENWTWSACSSPQVYTSLSYGETYGFAVKVQGAPITNTTMAGHLWRIAVPQVTITGGPPEVTESTEATLTFSSNPTGVDLVCYLDALEYGTQNSVLLEDWVPCTSPHTLSGLSRGYTYYFGVKPKGSPDNYAAMRQWQVTRLTLTASPNPSQSGSDVTFTATLWDDSGTTPGGTVSFAEIIYIGPGFTFEPIGQVSSPTTSGTGSYVYAFSKSDLAIGSHDIIALYTEGDSSITSLPITQVVTEVTTQAPEITAHPVSQTVCAGSSVSFTAAASGMPAPTVQWQVSNDSGSTWTNISGATTATYAFTAAAGDNEKRYRAVFTNSVGSATSSAAILTVNTAPTVTTQPTNQSVTYGVPSATFSAATSGTTPSVQWQKSADGTTWELVSGATTSNLTIANPTVVMSGTQYRADFTNVCGTTSSKIATLTVNKAPVTATAGNYSGVYDGASDSPSDCALTGDYTGDLTCTNNPASVGPDVSSGDVTANVIGTGLSNFDITYEDGTWEITAKPVTLTAGSYGPAIYDGSSHSPSSCTSSDPTFVTCSNDTSSVGPDVGSGTVSVVTPPTYLQGISTNYNITYEDGSWSITAAPVTITAGSYSATYDGASHSPSPCTVTADTPNTYKGALSCTNSPDPVGPDVSSGSVTPNLELNGETETNFSVTTVNGTYAITEALVTATAGDYSGTYDGLPHALSDCVVSGDYIGDLTCTNDPTSIGPNWGSGNVQPVVSGMDMVNFDVTEVNGIWSITKAPVTATAGDYNGTYDGVAHAPSDCIVTGDYIGDLACTNVPASVGPDVGLGIVDPEVSGTGLSNYDITNVLGSWSIEKAPVTATAGDYSGTYDGVAYAPSACTLIGDYIGDLACTNVPASVGPDVGSGIVDPDVSGTGLSNYDITNVLGSWSIEKASVTATAGDYSDTYDGVAHAPSACTLIGDYIGDLACTNVPASVGPDVGSGGVEPVLVLNGETQSNFTVTSQNGSWEITPAAVTIAAGDYSSTYDGAVHSPSDCEVTGAYKGDLGCTNDPSSVGSNVGSGDVEPVLVLNSETETNFKVTSQNGTWEITQAPVTATAGDYSGTYDSVVHPTSTCLVSGAYTGDLTCTNDPASVGPDVSSGIVTVDNVSGTGLSNFTITYMDGYWSITPAPVTVTAGSYSSTYDGAAHSPSDCEVMGAYTGDLACSNDPASVGPDVSSGIVTVDNVSGTGLSNFDITYIDGFWEITKATLTVTADNQTAQYSDATPPLTFQYAGFQGDDDEGELVTTPTCSTEREPSDPAGTFLITCSGGNDNNYTFSFVSGTFTVTHEDAPIMLDNEVAFLVDNPGEDIDELILYAYVQETYPDAGYEPVPGEIDIAQVSMTLTPIGPGTPETATCLKAYDNGSTGYAKINTYACTFTTVEVNTYLVEANVVGDYYMGGPAEDVLVVYDPSLGFTTAGGWFYWPGTTDKTNFGYTMKYNKKGNHVQGSLLLIRHAPEGNYRIKSNALYGLALGEFEDIGQFVGWASFSGKCTYMEPGWIEPEGNHVFLVYVEDWSDPGAGLDRIWFDVDGDEENLSMTSPAAEHLVVLNSGNIVVPHTPN